MPAFKSWPAVGDVCELVGNVVTYNEHYVMTGEGTAHDFDESTKLWGTVCLVIGEHRISPVPFYKVVTCIGVKWVSCFDVDVL